MEPETFPRETEGPDLDRIFDPAAFAVDTFGAVSVGDVRRTDVLVAAAAAMASQPGQSLPKQLQNPAALKAVYRVLTNPAVTVEALLAPHEGATRAAAAEEAVVLLVGDGTTIDLTRHRQTLGVGPVGNGQGQGYLLHTVLAVVPAVVPQVLGIIHLEAGIRTPAPRKATGRRERSWERLARERESQVWTRSAEAIGPPPPRSRWVLTGDIGSDIFEFWATARRLGLDLLIRVCHDRCLETDAEDPLPAHLRQRARVLSEQDRRPIDLPASEDGPARTALLAIAWDRITVRPPQHGGAGETPVAGWLVRVWEVDPDPAVTKPVEWLLLTTVAVETLAAAWERVAWYRCRWLVEDYHRCLKTGCRLEHRRSGEYERAERLLGMLAPLAVRLLIGRQLSRAQPDAPAAESVPAEAIAVVVALTGPAPAPIEMVPAMTERVPARLETSPQRLTVGEFWRRVARLGGHLGRRRDGPPGWQSLWAGWLYVQSVLVGVELAKTRDRPAPTQSTTHISRHEKWVWAGPPAHPLPRCG